MVLLESCFKEMKPILGYSEVLPNLRTGPNLPLDQWPSLLKPCTYHLVNGLLPSAFLLPQRTLLGNSLMKLTGRCLRKAVKDDFRTYFPQCGPGSSSLDITWKISQKQPGLGWEHLHVTSPHGPPVHMAKGKDPEIGKSGAKAALPFTTCCWKSNSITPAAFLLKDCHMVVPNERK